MPQWTVDILTNDNTEIVRGIPVVPNLPLILLLQTAKQPSPRGIACGGVNQDEEGNQAVGRQDFLNGKFTMCYVPRSK